MLGTVQNKQNTLNELNKGARDNWWDNAVIYQVYPRSFKDSNGDGEGDLQGVIQELPYLQDLGIDAIWLSPFYKSPNKDGGYDVSDPRDVDPRFGTLADAEELIQRAHESGIKVIFDIVPNHFSSDHVWFKSALAAANASALLDLDAVILGGGVAESGEIFWKPLQAAFTRRKAQNNFLKVEAITSCELGQSAGLIGAALHGMI